MRKRYLKEHRKALYAILTAKCELNDHLREIDRETKEQIEIITSRLAQAEGIMLFILRAIRVYSFDFLGTENA